MTKIGFFYSKEKEEQRTKDRKEGYLTARIFNCLLSLSRFWGWCNCGKGGCLFFSGDILMGNPYIFFYKSALLKQNFINIDILQKQLSAQSIKSRGSIYGSIRLNILRRNTYLMFLYKDAHFFQFFYIQILSKHTPNAL